MTTELVPGVTAGPDVAFGKPVIAGTRIPVAIVLGQLAAGVPTEEICREYELEPDQVLAALRHAAWLAGQESVRVRLWHDALSRRDRAGNWGRKPARRPNRRIPALLGRRLHGQERAHRMFVAQERARPLNPVLQARSGMRRVGSSAHVTRGGGAWGCAQCSEHVDSRLSRARVRAFSS
jgi:uncharacterized protein (DUF433 family)